MRFACSLFLALLPMLVNAADGFPKTCKSLPVLKNSLGLSAEKPTLILIHNLSENDIWLSHPIADPKDENLSTHLSPHAWSALVLDKKAMEFICIESKPGHEQQVPCVAQVALCQWTEAKLPNSAKGTF